MFVFFYILSKYSFRLNFIFAILKFFFLKRALKIISASDPIKYVLALDRPKIRLGELK
jgi:hypothetical protein